MLAKKASYINNSNNNIAILLIMYIILIYISNIIVSKTSTSARNAVSGQWSVGHPSKYLPIFPHGLYMSQPQLSNPKHIIPTPPRPRWDSNPGYLVLSSL